MKTLAEAEQILQECRDHMQWLKNAAAYAPYFEDSYGVGDWLHAVHDFEEIVWLAAFDVDDAQMREIA